MQLIILLTKIRCDSLGFAQYLAPYAHLDALGPLGTTIGPFRYTRPIRHHLRPTSALQAHLDALGPLKHHPRPTQIHSAHQAPTQAPQAHLDTLGPLGTTLDPLSHFRPIQIYLDHYAPTQAHLGILGLFRLIQTHSIPLKSPFR